MNRRILIAVILAFTLLRLGADKVAMADSITIAGNRKTATSLDTIYYNPQLSMPLKITSNKLMNGMIQIHYYSENSTNVISTIVPTIKEALRNNALIAIDSNSLQPLLAAIANDTGGIAGRLSDNARTHDSSITKDRIQNEARSLAINNRDIVAFIRSIFAFEDGSQTMRKFKSLLPNEAISTELKELSTLVQDLESNYVNVLNQAANKDEGFADLIKFKDTLESSNNPEDEKKFEEISAQINSHKEVNALRNHPNTQEFLKKATNLVKKAAASADENLKTEAKLVLDIVEGNNEVIFANPKNVSVANLPPFQKPDTHTTSTMLNTSIATSEVLHARMANVNVTGLASGEVLETYGAWIKGNFGTGTQRAFKNESGYSYTQKGITIGVDTGDESMVGVAYSFFQNDVKNKTSASTKDKINTHMVSVYGLYSVEPEMFVTGQVTYGISQVHKTRATGDVGNHAAKAKAKGNTMTARAEVGYIYELDNSISVVPSVGFAHTSVAVNGYSEKGEGFNRKIAKRTSTRASGLVGISLKHLFQPDFSQEIHANLDYAFSAKNPETKITLVDGLTPLTTPSEKASKAYCNIGGSVKVNVVDMLDIIAGYDLGLSNKFISHTGTLKLRINF
jgi:outer membrane autotransporter protein